MGLGTAGIRCHGHCTDTVGLAVGHCRDTLLLLGTAGLLCGWASQGCSVVARCRDSLRLGTPGIRCH